MTTMNKRGTCNCCADPRERPLYRVGTILGLRWRCARCCRSTYGCRPGYTTDGIRLQGEVSSAA